MNHAPTSVDEKGFVTLSACLASWFDTAAGTVKLRSRLVAYADEQPVVFQKLSRPSRGFAIVIIQGSSEPFATSDRACSRSVPILGRTGMKEVVVAPAHLVARPSPKADPSYPYIKRSHDVQSEVPSAACFSLLTDRTSLFRGVNSLFARVGNLPKYASQIVLLAARERLNQPEYARFPCIFPQNRET